VGSDKGQSCRVVGFALDQLPSAGFRGFRLGRFLSKPKPVCETMGSCFVEGDTGIDCLHLHLGFWKSSRVGLLRKVCLQRWT